MKVFICQCCDTSAPSLENLFAKMSIPKEGEYIVLLPEYINFVNGVESGEVRNYLSQKARGLRGCHIITSVLIHNCNFAVHYHNNGNDLLYKKIKSERGGVPDRDALIEKQNTLIEISGKAVRVFCCMDYAMAFGMKMVDEIILIPCDMGRSHEMLNNGKLKQKLSGFLQGNYVFMSNRRKDGCHAFHADKTGTIVKNIENSEHDVREVTIDN